MTDIDEKIRQALDAEDQKAMAELDDGVGLFELIGDSFKGKQAWMMYYMYFLGFAVFVVGLYFVGKLLGTSDVNDSINWALAIITCLFILTLVKVLAWQQLMKQELLKEMKRLEMRLMLVAEKSEK